MKNILLKSMLVMFVATSINPIKAESSFDYYFPRFVVGAAVCAAAIFGYWMWSISPSKAKKKDGDKDPSKLDKTLKSDAESVIYKTLEDAQDAQQEAKQRCCELLIIIDSTASDEIIRVVKKETMKLSELTVGGAKLYSYEKADGKSIFGDIAIETDVELQKHKQVILLKEDDSSDEDSLMPRPSAAQVSGDELPASDALRGDFTDDKNSSDEGSLTPRPSSTQVSGDELPASDALRGNVTNNLASSVTFPLEGQGLNH